jgi:hypothetical protein
MTIRYAYIENNSVVWGPGPNPYFITLTDGNIWEVSAHSVEESEAKGIYVVEQINKKDIDERFFTAKTPVFSIVNGKPIETWSYEFIPTARDNMIDSVDEQAEFIRSAIATKFSGQYQEYDEAYKEAVEVLDLPVSLPIPDNTYKLLEADVNVTFSKTLNRYVQNVREAAELIVETRTKWLETCSDIRKLRLLTKKNIKEATTVDEAYEIYLQYINETK